MSEKVNNIENDVKKEMRMYINIMYDVDQELMKYIKDRKKLEELVNVLLPVFYDIIKLHIKNLKMIGERDCIFINYRIVKMILRKYVPSIRFFPPHLVIRILKYVMNEFKKQGYKLVYKKEKHSDVRDYILCRD